jgi:hypothetical protein
MLQRQGRRNGGADGSLLIDPTEVQRTDNNGLQGIVSALKPLASRFGVSNADILHVAGILGVIICPGGPVIETWVGRKDAQWKNPTGLLPDVNDSVPKMVARFQDMGFTIRDLMALIGAHTTAKQRFVDPSRADEPQDTTPAIWDVKVRMTPPPHHTQLILTSHSSMAKPSPILPPKVSSYSHPITSLRGTARRATSSSASWMTRTTGTRTTPWPTRR